MHKSPFDLACTVLGWILAVLALAWLFAVTSCRQAESPAEYAVRSKHAECVDKWLKNASEAPTCQTALHWLGAMTQTDPACADSLADAGSVLVLVCEETAR